MKTIIFILFAILIFSCEDGYNRAFSNGNMSGISTRDIFMYRENQKYKWHGKTYFEWRNILLTQKDTSIVYLSSDPANSNDIILVVHYYDDILSVKLNVVAKPN